MRISHKLTFSFIFIIIFPLSVSYYISSRTTTNLIAQQINSETMSSLDLVGKNFTDLLADMSSLALYVNNDKNIREIIAQEVTDYSNENNLSKSQLALNQLNRINQFNDFFRNITFNIISPRSYITIQTATGGHYTNWAYGGELAQSYRERRERGGISGEIWVSFEENYVKGDSLRYPTVLTVGKNIIDGTFLISIPEAEVEALITAGNQEQIRFVLDADESIVSSTRKDLIGTGLRSLYDVSFPDARGYVTLPDDDGHLIISYVAVGDYKIVDVKSYDVISRQINDVNSNLLLFNAACIVIFIVMTVLISRGITRPLLDLTKEMRGTNPETQEPHDRKWRYNEVGILEEGFHEMTENINTLMQNNLSIERKKRDAELKALQAQISPHFLFNTLNTIRWAAINKNNKKAADMTLALSNLLRMTIVKGDEFITIQEELEYLQSYTDLFRMRYEIEITLRRNIPEDLLSYRIPKLLLQPLVENSIIHGFEDMERGGTIEVRGTRGENHVRLQIIDNGKGLRSPLSENAAKELKFSGIGIDNVNERIKMYFGEQYGLTLAETDEGTVAELTLPTSHNEGI